MSSPSFPNLSAAPVLPLGARAVTMADGTAQIVPEENAVALVYDGTTQAVMMATPADLEDFLIGFAITEGLVASPDELSGIEVISQPQGMEVRGWLTGDAGLRFLQRRRAMAGPVGCGLCGIDSLEQALRPMAARPTAGLALTTAQAEQALNDLRGGQVLKDVTRATHAAGFWYPGQSDGAGNGIILLREDVGRHNALDKLAGALCRQGIDPATGAVVMTSRVSVDLVQKAAAIGAGALVAPSTPTTLAVSAAQDAGLRLIARGQGGMALYVAGSVAAAD